jgi:hypothetical protein
MRDMERSTEEASQTQPNRSHGSSWSDRTLQPDAQPGEPKESECGPSGQSGLSDAGKEPDTGASNSPSAAERQPRSERGRFRKAGGAGRYNENLARQAEARRQADAFKAQVLQELGGSVDASKQPLLDALCETKVRAEAFRRKGRVNKFLEESERYVRLAYMLGLVKAGQHAEKPAPREMPARDHAEWIEMRRRRKR